VRAGTCGRRDGWPQQVDVGSGSGSVSLPWEMLVDGGRSLAEASGSSGHPGCEDGRAKARSADVAVRAL
jgi:hypothetical protein